MADYYATARSNYFAVRDRAAFQRALAPLDLTTTDGPNGTVALLADHNMHHGWPDGHIDDTTRDWVPVDLAALIADHLADDHVAILMEAGAEGSRYLYGEAIAVNCDGWAVRISLEDIYDIATSELGSHVTRAEF